MIVLETVDHQMQSHGYLRTLKQSNREEYLRQLDLYAKKYYSALPSMD